MADESGVAAAATSPARPPASDAAPLSLSPEEELSRSARRRGPRAGPSRGDSQQRPRRKTGRKTNKNEPKASAPAGASPSSSSPAAAMMRWSPLERAVHSIRSGQTADLTALLSDAASPIDVNKRTPQGDVLLVEACCYARTDVVASLIADHGADVNRTSANKAMNRTGLSPLVAACMALQPAIVALLLQQPGVDLFQTFGKVNAALVCVLFSVPNGRTDAQNAAAIEILERLVAHAQRTEQLEKLLTVKVDQVNPLLHVAAALANWRAVQLLQDKQEEFGVDAAAAVRNARGHTALRALEMNAFQARNLQFCEPPRPNNVGDTKKGKRRQAKRKGRQQAGGSGEATAQTEEAAKQPEPESEADRQTFTRSRPDRSVEAQHVTRTVMELTRLTGASAIFSRKGDSGVRSILIQSLVMAELGVVEIANQIAEMPEDRREKPVYLDGLLFSAAALYPLAVKNPKEYKQFWQRAILGECAPFLGKEGEEAVKSESPPQLSPAAFKMITGALMSHRSLSRRVKVWAIILMKVLSLYVPNSKPLTSDKTPALAQCGDLSFFTRINETLYRSGIKLLFCIFDRTDIEEDESYDEEIEIHLIIALFEHFLQFFAPFARTIRDDSTPERSQSAPLGVFESFHRATAPVRKLWPIVLAGLENLDDALASPQRFSLVLHVLQVFEQLEEAFRRNEEQALKKLFGIMRTFVKQEATKRRLEEYVSKQVRLLHAVSNAFPLPAAFVNRLAPLKDRLDVLLRSDPKILGLDLYALASEGGNLVRLEHKVDYLGVLAEEHNGSVSVSISRASGANYVDFILQQVLSASTRHLVGELNVTLINEPGVGIGVVREFFQIVQSCFFNPNFASTADEQGEKPTSRASEIGSQWLEEARGQTSPRDNSSSSSSNGIDNRNNHKSKRGAKTSRNRKPNDFTSLFPLFELVDAANLRRDELRVVYRRPVVTKEVLDAKKEQGELGLRQKDLMIDKTRTESLKKIYHCVGRLLGLAIRNHQPLDANFPLAFWKFMFNEKMGWEDYCRHNEVFMRSLQFILDHDFDAEPLDIQFDYTTSVEVVARDSAAVETVTMEMELQAGKGSDKVTNANKSKYVELRAQQFFFGNELELHKKIREGLLDTIHAVDLKLFQPAELQRVVRGERVIDLSSLKKSVLYTRGASPAHGVIQRFWTVVDEFDQPLRAKLLTFWSGSPRPPVFGFESKHRSVNADTACWYIDVDPRMKTNQCPMASTCDRRLIIPDYPTSEELKSKLLVALELGAVGYDRM